MNEAAELPYCRVDLVGLRNSHDDSAALHSQPREPDACVTQPPAGVFAYAFEPVLADVVDIHREQKMRAAAQIEAEAQLTFRQPVWPGLHSLF